MSALGGYYRFQIKNTTSGTSSSTASTIKMKRWKPASDGSADWEASEQTALSQASITSGGYASGTGYDNDTSAGYYGADLTIKIVNGSSAGYYEVRLQISTDGGTTWGDNGTGEPVAVIYCGASATVVTTIKLR